MSGSESDAWILGVDIGGTNLVVGAVPWNGGPASAVRRAPTPAEVGPEGVVKRIHTMLEECRSELRAQQGPVELAGIGIGSPGPVERASGRVVLSPNLGWSDVPIRDLVAEPLGMPATLDNDANCATFGEWWVGAGRGCSSVVGLTIGTGIGGGFVLDGELWHGASDVAAEVGHMTIDFTGRRCSCGNYGCVEAYCSGPNIAARAREALEVGEPSSLLERVGGDLDRVSAEVVYEASVAGDPLADQVMTETARILGVAVANLVNLLNPEVVVIAGGVTRAGDHLFAPLQVEVRRRAFRPAVEACSIVPAALPDTAGVVGAAGVFRTVADGAG